MMKKLVYKLREIAIAIGLLPGIAVVRVPEEY